MSELDFKLLGGEFKTLPLEQQYLFKYFQEGIPRTFLCYCLAFGDLKNRSIRFLLDNFVDHTGLVCSEQRLRYLLKKINCLCKAVYQAQLELDLDKLNSIKTGKWKWRSSNEKDA